jgi:hypothetical protein
MTFDADTPSEIIPPESEVSNHGQGGTSLASRPDSDAHELYLPDQEVPILDLEQHFSFQKIPALKDIDFDEINTRAELMHALTRNIPLNEYGLPEFIYRVDMLDPSQFKSYLETKDNGQRLTELLAAAKVQVRYDQGVPSLFNGQPVWAQLPYEGQTDFQAFTEYLELPGARLLTNIRIQTPEVTTVLLDCNYWVFRARAYDLYLATDHARRREQRILSTESNHFLIAEGLFKRIQSTLEDGKKLEELAQLPVEELVKLLGDVAKLQRVSIGLPANGATAIPRVTQIPDVSLHIRKLTEEMRPEIPEIDPNATPDADILDLIGSDPEKIRVAQELILKISVQKP